MSQHRFVFEAGSTALVTGASGGIGEQFARQLAARQVNLVLVARGAARLQTLADELTRSHPGLEVSVLVADLSAVGAPQALTRQLDAAGITVDVLVNNAGVGSHDRFVEEDLTAVARQIQLNCGSLVALTGLLLPGMVSRRRGGVINVASTAGFQPTPTMAIYGASKAFVVSFTEALWAETRTTGVRVLALCPGPTETDFFAATGKQFLTRGRQTAAQVAEVALTAYRSGRRPTVISGRANFLRASGHRFLPRAMMARLATRTVQAAA